MSGTNLCQTPRYNLHRETVQCAGKGVGERDGYKGVVHVEPVGAYKLVASKEQKFNESSSIKTILFEQQLVDAVMAEWLRRWT